MAVDKRRFGRALRFGGTGSAGPDHAGYFAVDDPLATATGEPVDMAQVRADDAFIEALANPNRGSEADPLDERMASLLLSWRGDVDSEAAAPLLDIDTAAAAVRNAPRPANRQVFGPLAAAAAVLVIVFTGVGLAARDAAPGNPLFGVTKVLYSDKAKSVEAAMAVRTKLDAASQALASGRVDEAEDAIEQAQQKLPVVAAEDGQGDLVAQTEQLIAELERLTPTSPVPTVSMPPGSEVTTPAATPEPSTEPPTTVPDTTTEPPISSTNPGPETTSTSPTPEAQPPGGVPGDGTTPVDKPPDSVGAGTDGTDGTSTEGLSAEPGS